MIFSEAGAALWKALADPTKWTVPDEYCIKHTPSGTSWWTVNGGFFFDGYAPEENKQCLGLIERHILWRRAKRIRDRGLDAQSALTRKHIAGMLNGTTTDEGEKLAPPSLAPLSEQQCFDLYSDAVGVITAGQEQAFRELIRMLLKPPSPLAARDKLVAEVIAAAREIPGMHIKAGARLHPPRLVAALAALDAAPLSHSVTPTDADVEAVEAAVGMGHAAWDTIDPKDIIKAARNLK